MKEFISLMCCNHSIKAHGKPALTHNSFQQDEITFFIYLFEKCKNVSGPTDNSATKKVVKKAGLWRAVSRNDF